MLLSEALQEVGVTRWRQMARYYHLEHLEFNSNRLYQALFHNLQDVDVIAETLRNMHLSQAKLLKAMALAQYNNFSFDYRHWQNYLIYLLATGESSLAELENRGLIFQNNQHLYVIPTETAAVIIDILRSEPIAKLNMSQHETLTQTGGVLAVGDVIRLLDSVRKSSIKLNKANALYKRDYERLDAKFSLRDENYHFNIGTRFDFIYNFITVNELVEIENSQLVLSNKGQKWCELEANILWKELYQFWLSKYPIDAAARVALPVLIGLLTTLVPVQQFIDLKELKRLYVVNGGIIPVNVRGGDWWQNTMNELVYLGVLQRSIDKQYGGIALNELGNGLINDYKVSFMAEQTFMMQPNFEVLISSHSKPKLLWRLASLAEDQGGQEIYRYRLTKNSIYQALLHGWNQETITTFLQEKSQLKISANVMQTIADWCTQFGKLFFVKTCLLSCQSKSLVQEILAIPSTAKYVIGKINATTLIVPCENYQALLKELETRGYMPYKQLYEPHQTPKEYLIKE